MMNAELLLAMFGWTMQGIFSVKVDGAPATIPFVVMPETQNFITKTDGQDFRVSRLVYDFFILSVLGGFPLLLYCGPCFMESTAHLFVLLFSFLGLIWNQSGTSFQKQTQKVLKVQLKTWPFGGPGLRFVFLLLGYPLRQT